MKRVFILFFLVTQILLTFPASEEDLFSEAENHYRAGNYLLALDTYTEFVDRYPLSDRIPDVQYRRGVSLFRLQHYNEAVAVFDEIEKRYRSTRYFEYITFWKGVSYYRMGNFSRTIDALEIFLRQTSDSDLLPKALLYKGLAEVSLKRFKDASIDLESLIENYFDSPHGAYGLILLFYVYLREGRYDDILASAEQINEERLPEKWQKRFKLYTAEALWEKGNLKDAELIYLELLNEEDDITSTAYRRLFLVAQAEKNLSKMENFVQQAEQRFSGSPKVLETLWVQVGIESFKQNNLELSEYFLTKVWNLSDRKSIGQAVPLYLAEILIKNDNLPGAAAILEEYLTAGLDKTGLTLMRLGDIRMMQDNFKKASTNYSRYMEGYPSSNRYHEAGYFLAYSQFRLKEWEPALDLTSRLLKDTPQNGFRQDLYRLQVVLKKKIGNPEEAVRILREYITLYPDDIKARIDFLKLLFVFKDFQEIIAQTDLLFQKFPLLKEQDLYVFLLASYLRGLSEISRKNYAGALKALNIITPERVEAVNLSLILPYSYYYQGWSFYRLAKYKEARERLIDLLEQFPAHKLFPQALFLTGWCSFSLGDYRAAVPYFARLAKMEGELSAKAVFLQGKSLLNLEELEEASQVFMNLLSFYPASVYADDALFEYSETKAKLGEANAAAEGYWDLAERYPQSVLTEEAMYKRGEVFRSAGQFQQAKDAYFEYRNQFSKGRLVDASLYWGGISAYELGESFGAVLAWEKLIDNYRDSPFRPDALKRTAEIYADRGDYRRAINLITVLINEYPEESKLFGAEQRADELRYLLLGLSDREATLSAIIGREGGAKTVRGREAMIELSRLYIYEGSSRIDLAYQMLGSVIEKEDRATASQAQFLIGEYFYRKDDLVLAAEEFLKAAYLNPEDSDLMAASMFRAAEMMHLAGNERDVRELVQRLERHFPDSQWTVEAKKLLDLRGGG